MRTASFGLLLFIVEGQYADHVDRTWCELGLYRQGFDVVEPAQNAPARVHSSTSEAIFSAGSIARPVSTRKTKLGKADGQKV